MTDRNDAAGTDRDRTAHPPVLALTGVSKSFGGAQALSDISLDLVPGEVHALVGMNGAGKSTLVGVLSGAHTPDGGSLEIDGQQVPGLTPRRAREHGIATVPQKRDLVTTLSVTENLFLGRLPRRRGLIDWRTAHDDAGKILARTGIHGIDPRSTTGDLTVAEQTKVEIAREVQRGGRILILDEPTASLSGSDAEDVHELVRMLRSRGTAIVYISHHLEEILGIADRVTVLRDGEKKLETSGRELTVPDLVQAMAGDRVESERPPRRREPGENRLSVCGLTVVGRLDDFSVDVHAGEVVAVLGPAGHGQSALFPVLSGLRRPARGTLRIGDEDVRLGSVTASLTSGLRCITGDRLSHGLVPGLTVDENIVMARDRFEGRTWLSWTSLARRAAVLRDRFRITMIQQNPPVGRLSGGNQQKVLLSKWLDPTPPVALLEEPTNGVDVSAKAEIHRIVDALTDEGTAVLLVSSDVDEVIRLADRIAVVNGDRLVAERAIDDLTREQLIALTVGETQQTSRDEPVALSPGAPR